MDTAVMESHLDRAVLCLASDTAQDHVSEVMAELRWCEQELVTRRFSRSTRPDGTPIRVRVAAVDAALIHVTRALSLVGDDAHLLEAKVSIERARAEVAHLS